MNDRLKQLYQSVILKHSKEPVHFEKKEQATHVLEAYNPLCGDKFQLFFEIEDGKISQLSFHGYGCAISKASASVLVKKLEGRPVEEGLALCREFLAMLQAEKENPEDVDEELAAFAAARSFPGRMKCATLSWEEMETFLGKPD
ncbi:MAG: SUF system NifU family Fe-S cluster assembly protein [Lewinellaceae bacterium]|nr:SUF system NifU family Fe-S cluster assembly protein [Lewinellaceae bacterium]MCB9350055.1 SUF system NifU family Fe-S cluster assembly protein [Lewinellaceae bacterium]